MSCCAIQIRPTHVSINFLSPARNQPLIANCQTVFQDRYRLTQAVFSQEYHLDISAFKTANLIHDLIPKKSDGMFVGAFKLITSHAKYSVFFQAIKQLEI